MEQIAISDIVIVSVIIAILWVFVVLISRHEIAFLNRLFGSFRWPWAMFRPVLREILVFHVTGSKLIHTIFCPPMRIVALDMRGQVVFDKDVLDWQILRLPECRVILEMAINADYRPLLPEILSEIFVEAI